MAHKGGRGGGEHKAEVEAEGLGSLKQCGFEGWRIREEGRRRLLWGKKRS
jgi:hypothetical protein